MEYRYDMRAVQRAKLRTVFIEAILIVMFGGLMNAFPKYSWVLGGAIILLIGLLIWDSIDFLPARKKKLENGGVYIGDGVFYLTTASQYRLALSSLRIKEIQKDKHGNIVSITLLDTEFNHKIKLNNLMDMNSAYEHLKTELK